MFKKIIALSVFLLALSGGAHAATATGNFNSQGYDVIELNVAVAGRVSFAFTGGYYDPAISLFDDDGKHIISNDDTAGYSWWSSMSRYLDVGNYDLLVTYCCVAVSRLSYYGHASTVRYPGDGSSYLVGGSSTLDSVTNELDSIVPVAGSGGAYYSINITGADVVPEFVNQVPEPNSMALAGLALLGLSGSYRRWKK